jgi:hypothetical protein
MSIHHGGGLPGHHLPPSQRRYDPEVEKAHPALRAAALFRAFNPRYKRAIHVDMRYLRWLLAKVYPAPHLLKEMQLPAE